MAHACSLCQGDGYWELTDYLGGGGVCRDCARDLSASVHSNLPASLLVGIELRRQWARHLADSLRAAVRLAAQDIEDLEAITRGMTARLLRVILWYS